MGQARKRKLHGAAGDISGIGRNILAPGGAPVMMQAMSMEESQGPIGLLLEHLRQRAQKGETHVWLSPAAREVMRAWHWQQRGGREVAAPAPAPPTARSAPRPAPEAGVVVGGAASDGAAGWPGAEVDSALVSGLEEVRAGVVACPVYGGLRQQGSLRETLVFSAGHPGSPLVFVGEAPGGEEEVTGEPFVGPAGQLLTKMITAMGLQRPQVYITHLVKYRPAIVGEGEQGLKNRRPTAEEIAAGLPHLRRELALLRPRVLVALGATAWEGLAGGGVPSIGEARGRWRDFEGIPLMPTFHPSYLIHNSSLAERRKVWEDLLQVMEKLGLPVSPKQRSFFKG